MDRVQTIRAQDMLIDFQIFMGEKRNYGAYVSNVMLRTNLGIESLSSPFHFITSSSHSSLSWRDTQDTPTSTASPL